MKQGNATRKDEEVAAIDIRERLTELMNRAHFGRERFVLTVHGEKRAAIVGIEDYERLAG